MPFLEGYPEDAGTASKGPEVHLANAVTSLVQMSTLGQVAGAFLGGSSAGLIPGIGAPGGPEGAMEGALLDELGAAGAGMAMAGPEGMPLPEELIPPEGMSPEGMPPGPMPPGLMPPGMMPPGVMAPGAISPPPMPPEMMGAIPGSEPIPMGPPPPMPVGTQVVGGAVPLGERRRRDKTMEDSIRQMLV